MAVLIVGDSSGCRELLARALTEAGVDALLASSARAALEVLRERGAEPALDAMLLDLEMADRGMDFLRELRENGSRVPVILLSDHEDTDLCVQGLRSGADDYVTKSVPPEELLARVEALRRRHAWAFPGTESLRLDVASHRATYQGADFHLTPREFEILRLLAEAEEAYVPSGTPLEIIWGGTDPHRTKSLQVLVSRLRKKLLCGPCRVEARHGSGYRLVHKP